MRPVCLRTGKRKTGCPECAKKLRGELKHKKALENNGSITNAIVTGKINVEVNVNEESGVSIAETLNAGIAKLPFSAKSKTYLRFTSILQQPPQAS